MPTLNIYKETFKQQLLVYIQFQEAIAHDTAPSQTPIKTEKRSTTHCRLRQRRAQGLGQHSGKWGISLTSPALTALAEFNEALNYSCLWTLELSAEEIVSIGKNKKQKKKKPTLLKYFKNKIQATNE